MSEVNVDARLIGIISKPHGIKGEVNVMLLTDYPKTIKRGDILFFDRKCINKAEVEDVKLKEGRKPLALVIKFKQINDRNRAEEFKGTNIFRHTSSGPKLKRDQYWVDDIIGCRVYTRDKVFIGKAIAVEKLISNDNLKVKIENKDIKTKGIRGSILYVPVINNYIDSINTKERMILLKKIPEYI